MSVAVLRSGPGRCPALKCPLRTGTGSNGRMYYVRATAGTRRRETPKACQAAGDRLDPNGLGPLVHGAAVDFPALHGSDVRTVAGRRAWFGCGRRREQLDNAVDVARPGRGHQD